MASLSDRIYINSPIWIQQLIVAIYGYRWYKHRFGAHFHRLVEEYKSREDWNIQQFRNYQEMQLSKLLSTAWDSPYYRQMLKKAGFSADDPPFETLVRLPYLTKETLRTRAKDLLAQNPLPRGVIVFKSSGTTGTPTDIYYTPEFHALELAVPEARNLNWAGLNYKDRRVMFGVRKVCRYEQDSPPFWRFSPVENMAYASIYHLSPKFLPAYLEFLRAFRPQVIMGYPSAIYTIARYALENSDLLAPAGGIFTTSETVSEQHRRVIEAAWNCKIYDRYGAVENCLFASQCEYGRYHISPDVGIIEIVDHRGEPCPPGVMGEVICTGLQNALQPLIRYQIGDVAKWALEQNCPCGRAMPILEGVEGRFEDICYTPDGREMLRFDTVFKGVDEIREGQVIQVALDEFTIRVVPNDNFNEQDANHLRRNMRLHVGDVKVNIELVKAIERTSSGKFRAVISLLHEMRSAVEKTE